MDRARILVSLGDLQILRQQCENILDVRYKLAIEDGIIALKKMIE